MNFNKKINAFTLQELLIVLVIIGILVLLALPSLMPLISKTKSTEAKLQLEHVYNLQKMYFMEHSRYSDNLEAISFEQAPLITESENGNANYKIEIIQNSNNQFLARATAVVDFDGDGEYNVWEIDHNKALKEIVKD
ncbi:MAG: prepilin-type N-terminal cleavage/methylation domain-containing protein [Cytophagales bacterium]